MRLSVASLEPARVHIEGDRTGNAREWSFRNTYAGIGNLGERIENLTLTNGNGAPVEVRKLAPGEYEAKEPYVHFSYEVKLDALANASDAAHVSWLTKTHGILMLNDLLPRLNDAAGSANSADVGLRFTLPSTWKTITLESKRTGDVFAVKDATRTVFFVGQNLREQHRRIGEMNLTLAMAGEWAFTDEDVMRAAQDVLRIHSETIGGVARGSAALMLAPFPRSIGATHWSAETRGGTTLLLLRQSSSRAAALAQLSVPLAHELFHLWIPNGLALDGNYDWFYEGFTQYQSLRLSVRLGALTFQEFLNAIGGAFDAYRLIPERDQFSLIEASERRWTSAPGLVYQKGLLTAFLYDLMLREKTDNKHSLDDVYRALFSLYGRSDAHADGNAAVTKALSDMGNMQNFTQQYVMNANVIDLSLSIQPYGLKVEPEGIRTRLAVIGSPNRKQRDLLRRLGYNSEGGRH